MNQSPSFYNRSLERALQILCAFDIQLQSSSLSRLSKMVDLPKSTVSRLCSTLIKYDFLRYDFTTKEYSLGLKLFELGGIVFSSLSLRKHSSPYIEQLQARLGKTTFLGVLRDNELIYIDKKEDLRNPIRFSSHFGQRRPPYFGMLGQVLMAYLTENEVDLLLEKYPLPSVTRKSVMDPKVFKQRLRKIRQQGYFIDEEEAIEGITGVSSPIHDSTGKVVAAIGVGFITSSVGRKEAREIRNEVMKTALQISQELGYLSKLNGIKYGLIKDTPP